MDLPGSSLKVPDRGFFRQFKPHAHQTPALDAFDVKAQSIVIDRLARL